MKTITLLLRTFLLAAVYLAAANLTAIAGGFAEGGLPRARMTNGNSYGVRVPTASLPSDWRYREVVYNKGTRSEYTIGYVTYRASTVPSTLGRVVTPIGEFEYAQGTPNSWRPESSPGWRRISGAEARTTLSASESELTFDAEARARGWYLGAFDARKKNTPRDWMYAPSIKAWISMEKPAVCAELESAYRKLRLLVSGVEEFRRRIGDTPGTLELLVTGPSNATSWAPIVSRDTLIDPWRNAYEIENFARLHARTEGRDFAVRSKGPDGVFGSSDDLDLPEPVNPKPSPFEGLLER